MSRDEAQLQLASLQKHSFEAIFQPMTWDVEYTDEFSEWWSGLTEAEQISVAASVRLLEARGPALRHPHSSGING